jgi:hypothetical protein
MTAKTKPCLISCSVLRNELKELVKTGALDVDLSFYSMELHSDYGVLEKNLRKKIEASQAQAKRPVVVVSGDYCLGAEDEAKKLMDEYGIAKVDALNCIDCLFGGKGQFSTVDPNGERIFLSPGWIPYFYHKMKKAEGAEHEETFRNMFSGLKGIVLLDTLGDLEDYRKEIDEICSFTRLPVLETRKISLDNLRKVVLEGVNKKQDKL